MSNKIFDEVAALSAHQGLNEGLIKQKGVALIINTLHEATPVGKR